MSVVLLATACLGTEPTAAPCQLLAGQVRPPAQENVTMWQRLLADVILPQRKSMREKHWTYYPDVAASIAHYFPAALKGRPTRTIRVAEVGTMFGGLAEHLLSALPGVEVFVVDPFLAGYDQGDQMSKKYSKVMKEMNGSARELSDAWALGMAHDLTSRHGCRYRLFHEKSLEAVHRFENLVFDVIFVDGLHTFAGVAADLAAYWPLVNSKKGILIGNDFRIPWFPGVQKAFRSFVSQHPEVEMIEGHRGVPPGDGNVLLRRKGSVQI